MMTFYLLFILFILYFGLIIAISMKKVSAKWNIVYWFLQMIFFLLVMGENWESQSILLYCAELLIVILSFIMGVREYLKYKNR